MIVYTSHKAKPNSALLCNLCYVVRFRTGVILQWKNEILGKQNWMTAYTLQILENTLGFVFHECRFKSRSIHADVMTHSSFFGYARLINNGG